MLLDKQLAHIATLRVTPTPSQDNCDLALVWTLRKQSGYEASRISGPRKAIPRCLRWAAEVAKRPRGTSVAVHGE